MSLFSFFRSGTNLFCVIYYYFGNMKLKNSNASNQQLLDDNNTTKTTLINNDNNGIDGLVIDPSRIYFEPNTMNEISSNVAYVFELLQALKIYVFWDVDDWINSTDIIFILLQLNVIYEAFQELECVLPILGSFNEVLDMDEEFIDDGDGDVNRDESRDSYRDKYVFSFYRYFEINGWCPHQPERSYLFLSGFFIGQSVELNDICFVKAA